MLDQKRKDFGPDDHDDRWLFCWENGKPPHPDTITRRFKKLANAADLPEIDLRGYADVGITTTCGTPTPRLHSMPGWTRRS